ncbi:MAG: UDP-N-acetylmuramate dehydrogenase [Myxococcota bacterium]
MAELRGVERDVALGPLTTLAVGGDARFFFEASSIDALTAALAWAKTRGLPTLILGDGSNVFIGDDGFEGLVIRLSLADLRFEQTGDVVRVAADAGAVWDALVDEAVARDAAGIECLTGIPGRVGAAPIQNIGAYGQEVAETVEAVEAVERSSGRVVKFSASECAFAYRDSRFKRSRDEWVITRVHFVLHQGGAPALRYAELARRAEALDAISLTSVRTLVRSIRAEKSMLRVKGDPNFHSAGSFFVNPIVDAATATRIDKATTASMPRYPAPNGGIKLSAAWLIERAGFSKGWGDGLAGLSTRHTLAIVNRGSAHAHDILTVAVSVRDGVREAFGVTLVPEPVLVGVMWPT